MPVKLVDALKETLEDWKDDLPLDWRSMFSDVKLGFSECDQALELKLWEPIFPSRRHNIFPGEPEGSHIFRAFDNIEPNDVKCIILGQDPYPEPGFATGRAFEAGNLANWREMDKMFSKSIRVLIQQICTSRTGVKYDNSFADWPQLLNDIEQEKFEFTQPHQLIDGWVSQGVLLLNASLTISRFKRDIDAHQALGHEPVWHPLIQHILKHFADQKQPVVFMAFGDMAIEHFEQAEIEAGFVINRPHPAFDEETFALKNPFLLCNEYLAKAGQEIIKW